MKLAQAAHMVDVRVRADDYFYDELMTAEKVQDAIDFVAGSITSASRVAGSPMIEQLHCSIPTGMVMWINPSMEALRAVRFVHERQYIIGDEQIRATSYVTCVGLDRLRARECTEAREWRRPLQH